MSKSESPLMSVIVPFKNEGKTIFRILDSLAKQETDFAFEVIMADGCSVDDTVEIIKTHPLNDKADVIIIQLPPDNHGMTVARNVAFEKARGRYIVFSQSDIHLEDSMALAKTANALEPEDVVGTYCIMKGVQKEDFQSYDYWGKVLNSRYVGVVNKRDFSTKFNAVKADVFKRMSGFDEKRYAWGGEDFDFEVRLSKEGRIAETDVVGTHMHALGRKQTLDGLVKKFCRNAEVMGACYVGYLKNINFKPGIRRKVIKEALLCAIGLSCLVPQAWPWAPLVLFHAGLVWQSSSYKHIRDWRVLFLPVFGLFIMACFTFYFLKGLLSGKTSVKLNVNETVKS